MYRKEIVLKDINAVSITVGSFLLSCELLIEETAGLVDPALTLLL